MKLSIIDQSPVPAGFTPADALHNTIELAQLAERLGYERYWIAEHHAIEALASPAPEILIARLGAETSQIRIGSGGVMLPHYSPMKVAEVFCVLHALYPGRVDLGVGRAPGGTPLESYALWRTRGENPQSDDFGQQLVELLAFLNRSFPANHPFSRIKLSPEMPGSPEVWLLGSSMWSASAAAQLGLPYAFAHFIEPAPARLAIEHYRSHFEPGNNGLPQPHTILAVSALCADTDEEAERLISSARLFRRRIRRGELGVIPTPEEAARELGISPATLPGQSFEPSFAGESEGSEFPRYAAGTPDKVRDQLIDMASVLHADELMIVTVMHGHHERKYSYKLMADAFGLKPR
ncbi:MAG: LLM class flavin-dependent oxidoreductase [Deltaproteobacteria bacterium]|nr:LLM class flavin-dependent oxidoreductase [Deltaproteobacteria bacterium]